MVLHFVSVKPLDMYFRIKLLAHIFHQTNSSSRINHFLFLMFRTRSRQTILPINTLRKTILSPTYYYNIFLFTFQPANAQDVKNLRNLQQNLPFRQNATLQFVLFHIPIDIPISSHSLCSRFPAISPSDCLCAKSRSISFSISPITNSFCVKFLRCK